MFKKSSLAVILSLLILSLLLASCNLPTNNNGLSEEMEKQTSVAQTVVALQTQMSVNTLAPANTAEPTAQPIPPTATMTSTVAIPTAQPTATNTPQPSYRIGNVTDLNYTDNTVVDPGVAFTKTWRVTNTGTATWGSNFKIVFISGDRMNGPSSQPLGKSVAPGGSIDISVTLTAPSELKTYQGYWMLQTESGSISPACTDILKTGVS